MTTPANPYRPKTETALPVLPRRLLPEAAFTPRRPTSSPHRDRERKHPFAAYTAPETVPPRPTPRSPGAPLPIPPLGGRASPSAALPEAPLTARPSGTAERERESLASVLRKADSLLRRRRKSGRELTAEESALCRLVQQDVALLLPATPDEVPLEPTESLPEPPTDLDLQPRTHQARVSIPCIGPPPPPPSDADNRRDLADLADSVRTKSRQAHPSAGQPLETLLHFMAECAKCGLDHGALPAIVAAEARRCVEAAQCTAWLSGGLPPGVVADYHGQRIATVQDATPMALAFQGRQTVAAGAILAVPLVAVDSIVGVLELRFPSSAALAQLSSVMRSHLDAVVSIAALFLMHTDTFAAVNKQRRQSGVVLRLGKALAHDSLDNELTLCTTVIRAARELIGADRCSVFTVTACGTKLRAFFENDARQLELPIDVGIAGHVARTGETVSIADAYEDPRFNPDVDRATGYRTKSILCMPVSFDGEVVAVAQLVNKHPASIFAETLPRVFTAEDEALFAALSDFVGVSLRNCRTAAKLQAEKRKAAALLAVATQMSRADIRRVDSVVAAVLAGAKDLLSADRASLFVLNKEHDELVSEAAHNTSGMRICVRRGQGFVGGVADSGAAVNVPDAYEDERFHQGVDRSTGYRTTSIATIPIAGADGSTIAVAQLINKHDDMDRVVAFDDGDLDIFSQFALFAGMALGNAHLLDFVIKAAEGALRLGTVEPSQLRRKPSAAGPRLGSAQTQRPSTLSQSTIRPPPEPLSGELADNCLTTGFDIWALRRGSANYADALDRAVQVAAHIVWSTGLPARFGCTNATLGRFVMSVCERYRVVPYHNFFHALDVLQTVHCFLKEGAAEDFFEPLECYVLLVVALVHDIDHMGLNNSYHMKTESPLGILSSATNNKSVLEVHHCNIAVELLADPDTDVFGGAAEQERVDALRGVIECILATDMARHGEFIGKLDDAAKGYDRADPAQRRSAMQILIKAADVSNVTKPFEISRLWGMSVTEEFYLQGDAEKSAGLEPIPMFDRAKRKEMAQGQLDFINGLALAFFTKVAALFKGMRYALEQLETNKRRWQEEIAASALAAGPTM